MARQGRMTTDEWSMPVLVGVLFFVIAIAGMTLSRASGNVAAMWLANAPVVAVLLATPRENWWRYLLSGFVGDVGAHLATGDTVGVGLGLAVCNTVEIVLAALLLDRFCDRRLFIADRRQVLLFILIAGGIVPAVSATGGAAVIHLAYGTPYFQVWPVWWAADACGLLILTPSLMMISRLYRADLPNVGILLAATVGVASVALVSAIAFMGETPLLLVAPLPPLLFMALRFGAPGGAVGVAVLGVVSVVLSARDFGPFGFGMDDPLRTAQLLQLYLAVVLLSVLPVGAVMSERDRLEDDLRRARDLADTANRSKSVFLTTMSHELRTPLNAILGFSETMREEMSGAPENARHRDYADHIHVSGRHLLGLIDDILDFAKVESGQLSLVEEPLELDRLVAGSVRLCAQDADRRRVRLLVDRQCPVAVRADARRLRQVLFNLIGNAVKFTPAGGTVTVGCDCAPSGEATISVTDTGIGMMPEDIPRALQPFVQLSHGLDRTAEGSGLGLPLAQRLVELHGGRMEIDSAPGSGTTVRIFLPANRRIVAADPT